MKVAQGLRPLVSGFQAVVVLTWCACSAFCTAQLQANGVAPQGTASVTGADVGRSDTVAQVCNVNGSSTWPGVRIEFTTPRCTWSLAEASQGVRIAYQVIIDDDIEGVVPVAQDAGQCDKPGPSGLIVFETLKGANANYGIYDRGLCLRPSREPVTLRAGVHPHIFEWDGRSWSGRSDTFRPKGDYFPGGTYTLTVSALGWQSTERKADFKVMGMFTVNLTE